MHEIKLTALKTQEALFEAALIYNRRLQTEQTQEHKKEDATNYVEVLCKLEETNLSLLNYIINA